MCCDKERTNCAVDACVFGGRLLCDLPSDPGVCARLKIDLCDHPHAAARARCTNGACKGGVDGAWKGCLDGVAGRPVCKGGQAAVHCLPF
jgi:hypothetical protein